MHPSPKAETVNPSVPSRRVFISVVPSFVTAYATSTGGEGFPAAALDIPVSEVSIHASVS